MSFIFTTHSNRTLKKEKVADWIGSSKKKTPTVEVKKEEDKSVKWKDVHSNIKQMDQIYDATFYAWLKSEENVLVTSIYLHRIANEYSLERIINALVWLTKDWRWESTSILVRHVTVDWCDEKGDIKRAKLLRHLTHHWAIHFTATLITTILITAPYSNCSVKRRERFLKEFTKNWDFSKLSEFFMFLRSKANIDYKFKCLMLQQAARRDIHNNASTSIPSTSNNNSTTLVSSSSSSTSHHHKRTASHDFDEVKRNFLEDIKENTDNTTLSASNNETDESSNHTEANIFNNRLNSRCYPDYVTSSTSSSSNTVNESVLDPHESSSTSGNSTTSLHRYHHHLNHTNLIVKK